MRSAKVKKSPKSKAPSRAPQSLFALILVSRLISELFRNYVWRHSNYLWSGVALFALALAFFSPRLVLDRKRGHLVALYWPIFLYLAYLCLRMDPTDLYSLKCVLSELIVWLLFIYASEHCAENSLSRQTLQTWVVRVIKVIIVVGIAQLGHYIVATGVLSIHDILSGRAVIGVFAHQNVFLVITLPFAFYFLIQRQYVWGAAALLCSFGTGTRGPVVAAACLLPLFIRAFMRKKLTTLDILGALVLLGVAYGTLIALNRHGVGPFSQEMNRLASFRSLQWRVEFWEFFVQDKELPTLILGHGIGSADAYAASLYGGEYFPPHNDYIRIYYDAGLVGLVFFAGIIVYMLREIARVLTASNVSVLLVYLTIVAFYITDNFIYNTHAVFTHLFMAGFILPISTREPIAFGVKNARALF